MVWNHESGTNLVWNEKEAYLLIRTQGSGWRGSYIEYVGQVARWLMGGAGAMDGDVGARKTVVVHLTSDSVHKVTLDGEMVGSITVQNDRLYATHRGTWGRWTGNRFVRVSDSERAVLRSGQTRLGEFTDVDGWSNRVGILTRREGITEFPIDLGGVGHTIVAHSHDAWRAIDVRRPGRRDERLFYVDLLPQEREW